MTYFRSGREELAWWRCFCLCSAFWHFPGISGRCSACWTTCITSHATHGRRGCLRSGKSHQSGVASQARQYRPWAWWCLYWRNTTSLWRPLSVMLRREKPTSERVWSKTYWQYQRGVRKPPMYKESKMVGALAFCLFMFIINACFCFWSYFPNCATHRSYREGQICTTRSHAGMACDRQTTSS